MLENTTVVRAWELTTPAPVVEVKEEDPMSLKVCLFDFIV
jgi:hypothetical protein